MHLSRRILIAELLNMGCCECIAKGGFVDMVSVQVSQIKQIAGQILQVALAIIFCQRGVVEMFSVQVS